LAKSKTATRFLAGPSGAAKVVPAAKITAQASTPRRIPKKPLNYYKARLAAQQIEWWLP
jgi:hypothetical protein